MTKKTNEVLSMVAVIVGFAGCFAAFGTASSELTHRFGLTNSTFARASIAGLGGAVSLLLWRAVAFARQCLEAPETQPKTRRQITIYESGAATRRDLPIFHNILTRQFGEAEVASLDLTKSWHRRNANSFQLLRKTNLETGLQLTEGGFKALPLADVAIPEIEFGKLKGSTIPDEFVLGAGVQPTAWWFGDLVSSSKRSNAALMRELRDFAIRNLQPNTRVYARPLTQEGLALMTSLGFVTIGDHKRPTIGRVCALYPEDVNDLIQRLNGGKRPRKPVQSVKRAVGIDSSNQHRPAATLAVA